MSKSGRALRLGRLFKADQTPLFLVPLDHTVTDGPFTDARGYDALLGILADNGADAIVVHKGRLRLLPRAVYARLAVVVISAHRPDMPPIQRSSTRWRRSKTVCAEEPTP